MATRITPHLLLHRCRKSQSAGGSLGHSLLGYVWSTFPLTIISFRILGLEGGAEPIAPLDEDEVFTGNSGKAMGGSISQETVADFKSDIASHFSSEGLVSSPKQSMGYPFKLFLVACILFACWMFVQAHGSRRGSAAGL